MIPVLDAKKVAAAGNPLIEQSAQIHWRHLRRVMGAVLRDERQRDTVWARTGFGALQRDMRRALTEDRR